MHKHMNSPIVGKHGEALTPAVVVDHATELYAESVEIAGIASMKPLNEWTQADRFAAAVVAGASLCFKDGTMQTLHPIAVEGEPGRWQVVQVTPPQVKEKEGGGVASPATSIHSDFQCEKCGNDGYREQMICGGKRWCSKCGNETIKPPTPSSGAQAKDSSS